MARKDYQLVYRSRRRDRWLSHGWPGPIPQAYSMKRIGDMMMCTCGHYAMGHKKNDQYPVVKDYKATQQKFRGRCNAVHTKGRTATYCPCSYFLEDQAKLSPEEQAHRDKLKYAWRPKGEKLPPLPPKAPWAENELRTDYTEKFFLATREEIGDWERVNNPDVGKSVDEIVREAENNE